MMRGAAAYDEVQTASKGHVLAKDALRFRVLIHQGACVTKKAYEEPGLPS